MVDSKGKKQEEKAPGCQGSNLTSFGLLAVMFVVFYFFLIRPQQKRQKAHQVMLNALGKGDSVITTGGLLGTIVSLTDRYATVEVADKIRVRVLRSHISGKQTLGNEEASPSATAPVEKGSGRRKGKNNKKDNA
ncbi:preprotein translocase subunit YajC [Myxococcota bacterium]|nr:preprotein translocase subunit YajC [Myxococcota bacterium]MBU1537556.1 preprotein translocase subunit YajC [Myxococcota bacterium]